MQTNIVNVPPPEYHKIKYKYPDAILIFRDGDMYNIYGTGEVEGDAEKASVATKLAVKDNILSFPSYMFDNILRDLVKAGNRVAVVEPVECKSPLKR